MKKAKIMVTIIAILAIVAGGLAFRVQSHTTLVTFYGCTTTNSGGGQVNGCLLPTGLAYCPTTIPGITIPYSRTTIITDCDPVNKTGCTAQVTHCL